MTNDFVKNVEKLISKRHDSNDVLYDATKLLEQKKKIIPISPVLDMATGGGIVEGTFTILSGPPKAGKTSTAIQIAANAQNLHNKFVYYLNIEGRIKPRDLEGVHGFDINKAKILETKKGKVLTAQDYLNDAIDIIKNHPGCILILDSVSALCSAEEFSNEISSTGRANGPKLLASFCRQMGGIVPAQDVCVIMIQHLIANTSGYGAPYIEDGGQKVKYQFDTKLRCKSFSKWLDGEEQVGNIIKWEVVGSPLSKPGAICESYLRFGHGLDEEMELVTVGCDLGLISKAGAWYTAEWLVNDVNKWAKRFNIDMGDGFEEKLRKLIKCQGQEKFKVFLSENEDIKQDLFEKIKELS